MTGPITGQSTGTSSGTPTSTSSATHEGAPGLAPVLERPTPLGVVVHQRKTIFAAAILAAVCLWTLPTLADWPTAFCAAAGVGLGLLNHLVTEFWLARLISSGEQPTRKRIAASTFTRLAILSVVAVGVAAAFWPSGVALLLGLAIFRLIALVMTGLPLLKELKQQ